MISSAVTAVIDWKSTAILVQITSSPTGGRIPRFGHVCGDSTSEAVKSAWRGSWGAIAMRLRRSQEKGCGYRSTVCHWNQAKNRMRHSVPSIRWHIHLDSRISCKDYKLSNCIDSQCRTGFPEQCMQPPLHIRLDARKAGGIQPLGHVNRLADRNHDPRQRRRDDKAIPLDLPGTRGRIAHGDHRPPR